MRDPEPESPSQMVPEFPVLRKCPRLETLLFYATEFGVIDYAALSPLLQNSLVFLYLKNFSVSWLLMLM